MEKNEMMSFKIKTLANLIKRSADNSSVKAYADKLTGSHCWFIGYLMDNADKTIYQKDLEKHFNIRRSTATGILQLMERNGLIIRVSDEDDKRMKKIVLTEKARQTAMLIKGDILRTESVMLKGISSEEAEACKKTLDKILENMKGDSHD